MLTDTTPSRNGYRIRRAYGLIAVVLITASILYTYWVLLTPIDAFRQFSTDGVLELIVSGYQFVFAVIGAILVYLFVPGLVGLLLSMPGALLWRAPLRIVLLRKFQRDDRSRALARVVNRSISPFGHVYTLSDRDLKTPWYIRVPVFFTQLVFLHFRARYIDSAKKLESLAADLDVRWLRNVNWIVAWRKVFPVRCSDDIWQDCVETLSRDADVILIDASSMTENIDWEVERCKQLNRTDRLILLTGKAVQEQTEDYRREKGLNDVPVVVYDGEDARQLPDLLLNIRGRSDLPEDGRQRNGRSRLAARLRAPLIAFPFVWFLLAAYAVSDVAVQTGTAATRGVSTFFFNRDARANAAILLDGNARNEGFDRLRDQILDQHDWIEPVARLNIVADAVSPVLQRVWESDPDARLQVLEFLPLIERPDLAANFWLDSLKPEALLSDSATFDLAIAGLAGHAAGAAVPALIEVLSHPSVRNAEFETAIRRKQASIALIVMAGSDAEQAELARRIAISDRYGQYAYVSTDYAELVIPLLAENWSDIRYNAGALLDAVRLAEIDDAIVLWERVVADRELPDYDEILDIVLEGIRASNTGSASGVVGGLLDDSMTSDVSSALQAERRGELVDLAGQLRATNAVATLLEIALHDGDEYSSDLKRDATRSLLLTYGVPPGRAGFGKPVLRTGTIGHVNAGKTTLSSALMHTATAQANCGDSAEFTEPLSESPLRLPFSYIEWATAATCYWHFDAPGNPDILRNLIDGEMPIDVAIVVFDAAADRQDQIGKQVALARLARVDQMVGFINKTDLVDDPELVELYRLELAELLERYGYEDPPVFVGSALEARDVPANRQATRQLLTSLDESAIRRMDAADEPTIVDVLDVVETNADRMLIGSVVAGSVNAGDVYEMFGVSGNVSLRFESCNALGPELADRAIRGDLVACSFETEAPGSDSYGRIVAQAGTVTRRREFEMEAFFLPKIEGGRPSPFFNGYSLDYAFDTGVPGTTRRVDGGDGVFAGDQVTLSVTLATPMPMYSGLRVEIMDGGRLVGVGRVSDSQR